MNFLCLTKFPKRMAEFDIPKNVWMGTTVDLQQRVANAEAAFAKINAGVRWLSLEPLLEPLKFKRLDLFDWIVIGGASPSSETPKWIPPVSWYLDLTIEARKLGIPVYWKTNLPGKRILELPQGLPIIDDAKVGRCRRSLSILASAMPTLMPALNERCHAGDAWLTEISDRRAAPRLRGLTARRDRANPPPCRQ